MGKTLKDTRDVAIKDNRIIFTFKASDTRRFVARDEALQARLDCGLFDGHKVHQNRRRDPKRARRLWNTRQEY